MLIIHLLNQDIINLLKLTLNKKMDIKIKITYLGYSNNTVLAKIIKVYGWYEISNKLSELGIYDNQIIKIERILTASDENIEDLSI